MANKKTVALDDSAYKEIITAIKEGFTYFDENNNCERKFRKNPQLAMVLQLEAVLGLRISDILSLRLSDIVKDGNRYRLDIVERKTKKARTFTVPADVYRFICDYAIDKEIGKTEQLFTVQERAIQKQLAIVSKYLRLDNISTHSFRKRFATQTYTNSQYNIELVRQLLQHSSTTTTQRYIGISSKQIEEALASVACDLQV